jgi:hypothetical protein
MASAIPVRLLNNIETIDKNQPKANSDLLIYKRVSMGYNTGAGFRARRDRVETQQGPNATRELDLAIVNFP